MHGLVLALMMKTSFDILCEFRKKLFHSRGSVNDGMFTLVFILMACRRESDACDG